jgi:hypothetical protein
MKKPRSVTPGLFAVGREYLYFTRRKNSGMLRSAGMSYIGFSSEIVGPLFATDGPSGSGLSPAAADRIFLFGASVSLAVGCLAVTVLRSWLRDVETTGVSCILSGETSALSQYRKTWHGGGPGNSAVALWPVSYSPFQRCKHIRSGERCKPQSIQW